jgi:hypothetical protein
MAVVGFSCRLPVAAAYQQLRARLDEKGAGGVSRLVHGSARCVLGLQVEMLHFHSHGFAPFMAVYV